jgi:hypothetical protein
MNNEQPSFRDQLKEPESSEGQNLVVMAIIGIILGLAIGYFVFSLGFFNPSPTVDTSESQTTADTPLANENIGTTFEDDKGQIGDNLMPAGVMSLSVPDQEPGGTLQIDTLNMSEGAWVVTFTSTEDKSAPERIIGAQYFNPGSYNNISAYLAEGTIAGEKYFVTFYRDDNVRSTATPGGHVFNSITDQPIIKNGSWILESFTVTSNGSRG